MAESKESLAQDAREKGDIVRGAILFHQGNINCISCHRPSAEKEGIGPNLNRLGKEVTDGHIIESILEPSKKIKEGYETTQFLTADGRVLSGVIVEESTSSVSIRTSDAIQRPIELAVEEIEVRRPSDQSNMPNGLANQLKDRRQFLDLLAYVFDMRGRSASTRVHRTDGQPQGSSRKLPDDLAGRVLIDELNCRACHQLKLAELPFPPKAAPDLKWSASRLNPKYLAEFIANPHATKNGTTMPDVLGKLSQSDRNAAASAIVHFLVARTQNSSSSFPSNIEQDISTTAAAAGRELFHSIGCVACHAPRDQSAAELTLEGSVPLGDLSRRYDTDSLVAFLENPHLARKSGRMPSMALAHREAINLSSYLLQSEEQSTTPDPGAPWKLDASKVARGREHFKRYRCGNCHTGVLSEINTALHSLAGNVDIEQDGCVSGKSGGWPEFRVTARQCEQISAALTTASAGELTNAEKIDTTLVAFSCTACHSRDGLGGVDIDRSPHFTTTNQNLGEQGRLPPTLTGVGAKLKPKWTRDVLINGRSIRPYMKTRMPQFGEENVGHLVDLLRRTDHLPPAEPVQIEDQKSIRDLGLKIVGNQGLNCVACHTYQYKIADTMPGVDLTEMAERLQKDWFHRYMLDPQRYSPNTVMPSFWPDGKAMRTDIEGTPSYQVEAIWQYLLDGRQARAPRGVIREPLEIVVTDEARMLRRRYPGMQSKRGIGIGYPGGINLSYDAEQMRLDSVWRGRFVDPSGVWYGQGHGVVRPLAKPISINDRPDLDIPSSPWPRDESRPRQHQFRGYELDDKRRPTLLYSVSNVNVEDYFSEFSDSRTQTTQLRRQITLAAGDRPEALTFTLATADAIEELAPGRYLIDGSLELRISDGPLGRIESEDERKVLVAAVQLDARQSLTIRLEYHF